MFKILLVAVFAFVVGSGGGLAQEQGTAPNASPLLAGFLDALNSRKEATIRAFVHDHCTDTVSEDQRTALLMDLVRQGAPFTLDRELPPEPTELKAVLENQYGQPIGLKIELSKDAPPRILRTLFGPPEALNAPTPKDYSGWTLLGPLADAIRSDTKCPALGIAVYHQGSLIATVSGTRTVNGPDAIGADEPWAIASIGQPICATIIGELIEERKLKWDTTLGEAFRGLKMQDGYRSATIEEILHHRGGIPPDDRMTREDVQRIAAGATDPIQIRENYAKDILERQPVARPGEKFVYSNAGYALLGVIAERITHRPYERLVKEMIFQPLSLNHSYTGSDQLPDLRPSGHIRTPQGLRPVNLGGQITILFAASGGGIFMSLPDLAAFGEMHLQGLQGKDGLLKSATVKRLHEGAVEGGTRQQLYACGWGIEKVPGLKAMHTHVGSNGVMQAQLAIFPDADLVIAAADNVGPGPGPSATLQAVMAVASRYAKE